MTLPERLEKLRFIISEMQLAHLMAKHAPDSFIARTIARHVVIRAENFITHTRAIRKPLNRAGYDTSEFHTAKEAYAGFFDEYFRVSRNKLGAHVQDFDFDKRIELWNDIEVTKLSFFVDGAIELYEKLAPLNIPGFVAHTAPVELSDAAFLASLADFSRVREDKRWVEFSADPLAMTRDNTTATMNFAPASLRAGQLALIRRWIALQPPLLQKFSASQSITRIFKARVVTDIVSFADCLVTRPVLPTAPQAMDGLDRLIVSAGGSSAPIDDFVAVSQFIRETDLARIVRDQIGAHFDDVANLSSLLSLLDGFDLPRALNIYDLATAAYIKACRETLFLRMYAADGQRAYGVTPSSHAAVPFSPDSAPIARPLPEPFRDEDDAYRHYLRLWLDGDEKQKGDGRQYFVTAFSASAVIEDIDERVTFAAGWRNYRHHYRRVDLFFERFIGAQISDADYAGVLDLFYTCGGIDPYALSEVLLRSADKVSEPNQANCCYMLGELGRLPHASVEEFLRLRLKHPLWGMRLQALIALFKMFIKAEGLYRVNHAGQISVEYSAFIDALLKGLHPNEMFIVRLAFASLLSTVGLSTYFEKFNPEYEALQSAIKADALHFLPTDANEASAKLLEQLIQTRDYVGVALLVAVGLEAEHDKPMREGVLNACMGGVIRAAEHPQAQRHLAMCYLVSKQYPLALQQARAIAEANPDSLYHRMTVVMVLVQTPGAAREVLSEAEQVRLTYKLDAKAEGELTALENAANAATTQPHQSA